MSGGLDLSKAGIIDQEQIGEYRSAFDILEEVQKYATEELGIEEMQQPRSTPPDLSEGLADKADKLTNEELATLHAQYVAYAAFLYTRLAPVEAAFKIAEANLKHIKSEISLKLWKNGVPKAETDDRVRHDSLYREFEIEYHKLFAMKKIIGARYESYDKQASSISRLITLRQEEMQQQLRDARVKGRKSKPGRPKRVF